MHKFIYINTHFTGKYGVSTKCIHNLDTNNLHDGPSGRAV